MALFTDTVTIYNSYGTTWKRTVLKGVQYTNKTVVTVSSDGKANIAKTTNVTIPDTADTSGKQYIDSALYAKLTTAEVDNYYTLDIAKGLDLIAKGELTQEIDGTTYRTKNLKADYTNVVTIRSIADNRGRDFLKNVKVVCD